MGLLPNRQTRLWLDKLQDPDLWDGETFPQTCAQYAEVVGVFWMAVRNGEAGEAQNRKIPVRRSNKLARYFGRSSDGTFCS
jgi:hypothetical protein